MTTTRVPHTAVTIPILCADRFEILLTMASPFRRRSRPRRDDVTSSSAMAQIRGFGVDGG